ncbi:chlorophyllase, partial [Escherichia coli]|nr:chlorophyllase [Escherichia coli]
FPNTSRAGDENNVLDVLNQPADVSYALTRVLALNAREGDPLRGRLATDRVAATGHSAGGVTTIGLFTAGRDDRLTAGIVFAGT